MSGLLELAARCEAAEGPDRVLDREIARAHIESILFGMGEPDAGVMADAMAEARLDADLDAYTASLDSAMSLIPEGWTCLFDSTTGKWLVELYPPEYDENDWNPYNRLQRATSPSFALAVAAVALRARAAK